MRKIFYLSIIILFTFQLQISAQYVDSGQDPASIKWQQINTENFQLIFPDFYTGEAKQLAGFLEKSYEYAHRSLKHKPSKISVILHNFTSDANANVLWAPKRSNFNVIPGQDIYPQKWLEQLALHEFRHVVQIDKMNHGLSKILYFIFGQQGTAAVFGAFVPFWLVEGDATLIETVLSKSGRGRLPGFEMVLRAQLRSRGIYSYEKAYLGSYKDLVPNYYTLGYFLTSYGRKAFGDSIWDLVLTDVARNPFHPKAFNHSLKKYTGLGKIGIYMETLNYMDSLWQQLEFDNGIISYNRINKRNNKVPLNYQNPQYYSNDQWIVLKQGLGQVAQFVKIDQLGNEEKIFTPGLIQTQKISCEDEKIVWCEYNPDIRWSNRLFSDLILYDINKKKRRLITRRRYIFSPDLSPDGQKIVAVEATPESKFSLIIFETETGKEIKKISLKGNPYIITPDWDEKGESVAFISLDEKGKSLQVLNLLTGELSTVLNPSHHNITLPEFDKNSITYNATYNGIDNIYQVELLGDSIYQLTNSQFGAFAPTLNKKSDKLTFSDFSIAGFDFTEIPVNPTIWQPKDSLTIPSIKLISEVKGRDSMVVNFDSLSRSVNVQPYRKWKNLFYFHSWGPININPTTYGVSPSITLISQNKLSTAFTTVALAYNYNEETGNISTSFNYRGWYPVITLSGTFGNRSTINPDRQRILWNENRVSLGVQLPFNLTAGKFIKNLRLGGGYSLIGVNQITDYEQLSDGVVHGVTYSGSFTRRHKTTVRDIRTRWGQDLQLGIKHSPFGALTYANQYYGAFRLYLPFLYRKHHSLMISGFAEFNNSSGKYKFSSSIAFPRGYSRIVNNKIWLTSLDYAFPICYPDWNFKGIFYIKRIFSNVFFDYSQAETKKKYNQYKTVGIDLLTNIHFFSHIIPFEIGVRYCRLLDLSQNNLQLLFNIEL